MFSVAVLIVLWISACATNEGPDHRWVAPRIRTETGPHDLPFLDQEPVGAIPAEFLASQAWPFCESIGQVSDQGACASDWAFAATTAMTDRICIHSNGTVKPQLSAENLLSCVSGSGCDGGYSEASWQHWQSTGIVTGGNYSSGQGCRPYTFAPCDHNEPGPYGNCSDDLPPTPACNQTCVPGYPISYEADLHFGASAYRLKNSVAKIQYEIMLNGPVQAEFTVYQDFLTYTTGVYSHQLGTLLGYHSLKLIGWGTFNGEDYWLAVNSWNNYWGQNGFVMFKRGSNECGIESNVAAGIPKL